jgi:hypothetical protein
MASDRLGAKAAPDGMREERRGLRVTPRGARKETFGTGARPAGGVHGRIAGALAQRQGRAG